MDYVLAIIGAALFCLYVALACARWEAVALPVLASAVIESHLGLEAGIKLDFTSIYLIDILVLATGCATVIRQVTGVQRDVATFAWLATLAAWAIALAYGAAIFGAVDALIGFRKFLYIAVLCLYVTTFRFEQRDMMRLFGMWMIGSVLLIAYAVLAKIEPNLSLRDAFAEISLYGFARDRIVYAPAALLIAQAVLIGLAVGSHSANLPLWRTVALILLPVVVLLYHRTVWLAMLAGIIALIAADPRRGWRLSPALLLIVTFTLGVWMLLAGLGIDFVSDSITEAVLEPLDAQRSALNWRVDGWQILVGRAIDEGPLRILLGGGFGTDYTRRIGWTTVEVSPHNIYVEIFLNAGLMGLLPFIAFLAVLMRKALRDAADSGDMRGGRFALIVGLAVYGFSYNFNFEQGLLLGALAALRTATVSRPQPQSRPLRQRHA